MNIQSILVACGIATILLAKLYSNENKIENSIKIKSDDTKLFEDYLTYMAYTAGALVIILAML